MERPPAGSRSFAENVLLDDDRFSAVVFVGLGCAALITAAFSGGAWPVFVLAAVGCALIAAYVEFLGTPAWVKVVAKLSGHHRPRRPTRRNVRGWR
jgi:hypothetical protein